MGLSIPSCGVGLRDGEWREEADWRACGHGRWDLDCCGTGGCGRGEYISDLFVESAAVAGGDSEAGRCTEDAGAAREARCGTGVVPCKLSNQPVQPDGERADEQCGGVSRGGGAGAGAGGGVSGAASGELEGA